MARRKAHKESTPVVLPSHARPERPALVLRLPRDRPLDRRLVAPALGGIGCGCARRLTSCWPSGWTGSSICRSECLLFSPQVRPVREEAISQGSSSSSSSSMSSSSSSLCRGGAGALLCARATGGEALPALSRAPPLAWAAPPPRPPRPAPAPRPAGGLSSSPSDSESCGPCPSRA